MLDADTCYQAVLSHDRRFDGKFFVGVKSTRIYCRPVCPARTPRRDRCVFFEAAALAENAGFVPCLRCRPDLAPGNAPMDAKAGLARRAARLLERNWQVGVESLAARLGVTSRHLRRALRDELGITPREFRQSRRISTAARLLRDTNLPLTRVAFASGFGSLRSFNAAFKQRLGRAPSALRAARKS
jgi:AraC family transcriptional regulator of adaptative response / DNA-3-methyladenine glycosylase II